LDNDTYIDEREVEEYLSVSENSRIYKVDKERREEESKYNDYGIN
jgi:hypothetical protein